MNHSTFPTGAVATHIDNYCENAVKYVKTTGVDFAVADLGTEQQSTSVGKARYDKARARELTAALGRKMLVLHGTSCLANEQTRGLASDGVVRVNMWTRIAREAASTRQSRLSPAWIRSMPATSIQPSLWLICATALKRQPTSWKK